MEIDDQIEDVFLEYSEAKEGEEDLHSLTIKSISTASVTATDWTTETILLQINKGNISLDPDFQRRDAWRSERKSRFIESLVLGFPVPQIVLAESKSKKGSYIVIDGKQRLLTLRQFAAKNDDKLFNQLKLTGLELRQDLNGKCLDDISSDLQHSEDLSSFENQSIRTVVIKSWPNEDFLYHVFLRLNTGSLQLSPQELRQALHPGPFVKYVNKKSTESSALKKILNIRTPDFRMRDVELLVRYYGFRNHLDQYKGDLKAFLDYTCEYYNQNYSDRESDLNEQLNDFEQACSTVYEIFGDNAFRKWIGDKTEGRFNRAIYDVMFYYFCKNEVRAALTPKNKVAIRDSFRKICMEDAVFLSAIERTTKSIDSVFNRLSLWGKEVNNILGIRMKVPNLVDGKII